MWHLLGDEGVDVDWCPSQSMPTWSRLDPLVAQEQGSNIFSSAWESEPMPEAHSSVSAGDLSLHHLLLQATWGRQLCSTRELGCLGLAFVSALEGYRVSTSSSNLGLSRSWPLATALPLGCAWL